MVLVSDEIIANCLACSSGPGRMLINLAENQCSAYRQGLANHFVELDTNCNLIRAV